MPRQKNLVKPTPELLSTYGGTFIYNSELLKTNTLGQYAGASPVGVAYHPVEDLVYFAWATTQETGSKPLPFN